MKDLPKGIIHGDMHDMNVLFEKECKELDCVLDWDDATYGPFLFDLAMGITEWCVIKEEVNDSYLQAFLKEYEASRKLEEIEKELLWFGCLLMLLWHIRFLIDPEFWGDEEAEMCIDLYLDILEDLQKNRKLSLLP